MLPTKSLKRGLGGYASPTDPGSRSWGTGSSSFPGTNGPSRSRSAAESLSSPTVPDPPISQPTVPDPPVSQPTVPDSVRPAPSLHEPPADPVRAASPARAAGSERFEPLRQEMLRALEAVSYQIGEAIENQLDPIWFPEPGKPIRRIQGGLSDQPFALRPTFEPPVVPKDALYAIQLLDSEGREVRLPLSLIRGVRLPVWPPAE